MTKEELERKFDNVLPIVGYVHTGDVRGLLPIVYEYADSKVSDALGRISEAQSVGVGKPNSPTYEELDEANRRVYQEIAAIRKELT